MWAQYIERRGEQGYDPDVAVAARAGAPRRQDRRRRRQRVLRGATGTPDQIREYLLRFEEAGVDQVIFVMQAGKNRHEHICESLELFGREVLPEFKDRDEAQVKAKADRLAPVIEAAMARKADADPAARPRATLPGHAAEVGRRQRQRGGARSGSRSSPTTAPPASRDATLGILG